MSKKRFEKEKPSFAYRIVKRIVRFVYRKYGVRGAENLPGEPCVIVANHCQLHGPLAYEFYTPVKRATWCAAEMMEWKEIPSYAYGDFWPLKKKWQRPFYKLASYLIAPLAMLLFNNAETIPVYRDRRIVKTLKLSSERMEAGDCVVIFPEYAKEDNGILCDLRDGFVDVARTYYKRTGKAVCFVPSYLSPKLKLMTFGEPVRWDPEADTAAERARIKSEMRERITALAKALPPHTVVPYINVPKREYPKSREE